jgi:hypothetical protein
MTTQERIEKVERMVKGIMRDGQSCGDFEAADSIGRTGNAALELLFDLKVELESEVSDELIAA